MIDLHIHTTYSDGQLTPNEVVRYAKTNKVTAIAITDHDSITGVNDAVTAGEALDIEVIPGVEFSTVYQGNSVHIVGLMINEKDKELTNLLDIHAKAMETKLSKTFANLISLGIENISYDEFFEQGSATFGNFMRYMSSKGIAKNLKELKKYIGRESEAYVPYPIKELTVTEAINAIHNANGIALWAHPLIHKLEQQELENTIAIFKATGLDGVEAYYPEHSESDFVNITELAVRYNLLISGGSDFHGKFHGIAHVGDLGEGIRNSRIPYSVLETMRIYQKNKDRQKS